MPLLLSELLPLRTTRALGDYADDAVLPIIFGDLSEAPFPLIRLSDTRYFVADHAMAAVSKVFVDKQATVGWAAALESDDQGHSWTVVTMASAVPQDAEVSACGKGMLDPDTGALIENPGGVHALITRLAGRDDDWSGIRGETSELDIRIAGRLAERISIKAGHDAVAQSTGTILWHGGARLYPTSADPSPILDLDVSEVDALKATAALTDTADVLRLSYDYSDAGKRALHYIELTASPQRYGGMAKEVVYPYLRTPANAETIGRPVLQRLNGQKYDVSFNSTNTEIRPGMWVRPVAHPEWMVSDDDPVIMVLQVELDDDTGSVAVRGETIVGQSIVTVTAHSIALPDTVQAGVDVSVRDGIATFTFTDDAGKPIPGARVSLDGAAPKTTDAQGKVRFPVEVVPGAPVDHVLAFEKAGFVPFTLVVPL